MERINVKFNSQAYEQACEWFVELRAGEPDESTRRAFHAWLKAAPNHMGAYLEVAAVWNESAGLEVKQKWPLEALIAEARKETAEVIALPNAEKSPRTVRRWRRPPAIAASIGAFALVIGALTAWQTLRTPSYVTAIGEQRSMTLPDGSTVHLNARSEVQIHYTDRERRIDLLHGQALFNVARDPARPFVVRNEATRVLAVGTQFDVNHTKNGLTVTVVEGRVAVSSGKRDAPSLFSAGEQAVVTGDVIEKSAHANLALATAWTTRQLMFASTPLVEVAEEFNRYNERQLVIEDAALEPFEIDGVFSSTDPASLIQFLRERPGIHVLERGKEIVIKRQEEGRNPLR